jgi:hypothetical protein
MAAAVFYFKASFYARFMCATHIQLHQDYSFGAEGSQLKSHAATGIFPTPELQAAPIQQK